MLFRASIFLGLMVKIPHSRFSILASLSMEQTEEVDIGIKREDIEAAEEVRHTKHTQGFIEDQLCRTMPSE